MFAAHVLAPAIALAVCLHASAQDPPEFEFPAHSYDPREVRWVGQAAAGVCVVRQDGTVEYVDTATGAIREIGAIEPYVSSDGFFAAPPNAYRVLFARAAINNAHVVHLFMLSDEGLRSHAVRLSEDDEAGSLPLGFSRDGGTFYACHNGQEARQLFEIDTTAPFDVTTNRTLLTQLERGESILLRNDGAVALIQSHVPNAVTGVDAGGRTLWSIEGDSERRSATNVFIRYGRQDRMFGAAVYVNRGNGHHLRAISPTDGRVLISFPDGHSLSAQSTTGKQVAITYDGQVSVWTVADASRIALQGIDHYGDVAILEHLSQVIYLDPLESTVIGEPGTKDWIRQWYRGSHVLRVFDLATGETIRSIDLDPQ